MSPENKYPFLGPTKEDVKDITKFDYARNFCIGLGIIGYSIIAIEAFTKKPKAKKLALIAFGTILELGSFKTAVGLNSESDRLEDYAQTHGFSVKKSRFFIRRIED